MLIFKKVFIGMAAMTICMSAPAMAATEADKTVDLFVTVTEEEKAPSKAPAIEDVWDINITGDAPTWNLVKQVAGSEEKYTWNSKTHKYDVETIQTPATMSLAKLERATRTYTVHNDNNFDVKLENPAVDADARFEGAFSVKAGPQLDPDKFEAENSSFAGTLKLSFVKASETYAPDYGQENQE